MVEQVLILAGKAAQLFREGKGQHEIGGGQQQITLQGEPCFRAFMLAFGTVTIAAGVIGVVRLPAGGTRKDLPAQCFSAAVLDGPHRLTMAGQDFLCVLPTIIRAVPSENICQFYCQSLSTMSLMVLLACALTTEVKCV